MKILAHRGFWRDSEEANREAAFERALAFGYGIETDIRDRMGDLVISHDPAHENCLSVDAFFELYRRHGARSPLALNVKADGLQVLLKQKLEEYGIVDYFIFDMSVPDALAYLHSSLTVYTRQSELEEHPAFYGFASGVWMDSFFTDWIGEEQIALHLAQGKRVSVVSPELHGRSHRSLWETLKRMATWQGISICTDFPDEAEGFFHG